jgi:uncharacterized membrane protein YccF (DUF307 family)
MPGIRNSEGVAGAHIKNVFWLVLFSSYLALGILGSRHIR